MSGGYFTQISNAIIKWHRRQVIQTAYKCNVSPGCLPAHYRAYKQHSLLYGYFSGCVTNKEPRDLLFRMFHKSNVLTSQRALCQSILPSEEL